MYSLLVPMQHQIENTFQPPFWLKNPYFQSILASVNCRRKGRGPESSFHAATIKQLITTPQGVRLVGYHSTHEPRKGKGLAILLHGWEGSSDSVYVLNTALYLFENGYNVFRLNLRDHGDSHALNKGLFFVTLFDEVFDAVVQACQLAASRPVLLAGFSLGGNYALRIGRRCNEQPIRGLSHVFAVSPLLNPERSTRLIDNDRIFKFYLMKKWKRSLRKKQSLFPDLYDFSKALACQTIMGITRHLIADYSPHEHCRDYFRGYTLLGNALKEVAVPTTIITAEDDPIIPVYDFRDLKLNPSTHLIIHPYGGHNGFFEFTRFRLHTWYERFLLMHCQP